VLPGMWKLYGYALPALLASRSKRHEEQFGFSPMAEVETSTRGRCAAGSAFTASTTARVAATLERLISALCADVHRVAMGSPAGWERWL
jgi:hypothetical protein